MLEGGPTRNLGDFAVELVTIIRKGDFETLANTSSDFNYFPPQLVLTPQWWLLIRHGAEIPWAFASFWRRWLNLWVGEKK